MPWSWARPISKPSVGRPARPRTRSGPASSHVWMRRRWGRDPDLHVALPAGGALDRPTLADEAPLAPEMARQSREVDVAHIRPPGLEARRTGHERAHAVVDQLAKRVDGDGVATLGHGWRSARL